MTFLRLAPAYPTIAARTSRRETSAEQRLDPFALLAQLGQGRVHALAAELVHGKTRHDAVLAAGEGDGVGVDDALGDAVAASDGTAMLTQSPSLVPSIQLRMWSIT